MIRQYKICSFLAAGVLLAVSASAQARRARADDADQKELYNYVLTMDKLQKLGDTTKALQNYAKQHPEAKDESNGKTLDDMVQKMQKHPEAVAIINKNGLSPREYAVGLMTLMQAGMAVGFKKSGTYKEYPPDMLKLVSKQNLDFVEQHWDAVEKMTKAHSDDQ
jgi:hypothetical protein